MEKTPAVLQLFGTPEQRGGEPRAITSLDGWFEYAGPRGGRDHWVPLRSAFELARAWCGEERVAAPAAFLTMLTSHPRLRDLRLVEGYAEHATPLRGEVRGPRVHDLLLIGSAGGKKVVVGVEAKADEEFDRPLKARWAEAERKRKAKVATNWPARLGRLTRALFGLEALTPEGELNPEIADLPYQLMSALAGTLIEAEERQAEVAVLAVHVFTSSSTRRDLVDRNRRAFASFVARIGGVPAAAVKDGKLYGPFSIPGGEATRIPSQIPVLLGELTTGLEVLEPRA